jgi:hypothetical protein
MLQVEVSFIRPEFRFLLVNSAVQWLKLQGKRQKLRN